MSGTGYFMIPKSTTVSSTSNGILVGISVSVTLTLFNSNWLTCTSCRGSDVVVVIVVLGVFVDVVAVEVIEVEK